MGTRKRAAESSPAQMSGSSAGKFIAGDSLRGLAALWVAIYHAGTVSLAISGHYDVLYRDGWTGPFGKIAGGVIGAGANGVGVFFVLSGYLISRPFLDAFADSRPLPRVGSYLRNRVLRLVPAYWVALLAVVLVAGAQGLTGTEALHTLAFSGNWVTSPLRFDFGQAWTLNVEARYYLLVPLVAGLLVLVARLVRLPRSRSGRLSLVGTLAIVGAVVCFGIAPRSSTAEVYTTAAQAPILLFGVALAAAELGMTWRWLASRPGRLLAIAAFAFGAIALVWDQYPGAPLPGLTGLKWTLSTDVIAGVAALLLVGVPVLRQRADGGCWRALDNRPLRWLGARSYGFYLYQLLVLTELSDHAPSPTRFRETFTFLIIVGFPVIMLAAALSWRLIEQPALRLKASTRPKSRAPVPTGSGADAHPGASTAPVAAPLGRTRLGTNDS
jgi:peptidoglycan/LPS O-acetylase OafA/YrhL